jgi:hypothetical protein
MGSTAVGGARTPPSPPLDPPLIASVAAIGHSTIGNFLGASALVIEGISNPETLEVMACREGLALVIWDCRGSADGEIPST